MATKKKTKKQTKRKKLAGKKARPVKTTAKTKKLSKSKVAKRKAPQKKAKLKTKFVAKKATGGKSKAAAAKLPVRRKSRSVATEKFSIEPQRSRSGVQSGDLQGLSGVEGAGSESVDELLEEGNAFEADAVMGVEEADDAEGKEVHTHEVLEDDVPGEYLDKD